MHRTRLLMIGLFVAALAPLVGGSATLGADGVVTHPAGTRTGVEAVDSFLDLYEAGDVEGLAARVEYRRLPCVAKSPMGEHPQCLPGEEPGTLVEVVWFGSWHRRADVPSVIAEIVASDWALFGVKSGARVPGGTEARFTVFLARPAPVASPYILYLNREGRLAGGFFAKHSTVCEAWIAPGLASPPQVLPPVERCPGPPPPPYRLRTVRILGGAGEEEALGMAADAEGNLAIAWAKSTPHGVRITVQRRSPDGRFAWNVRIPGAAGSRPAVALDGSTTYVATEHVSGGDTDVRVVALGPSSQVLWSHDIGGAGNDRLLQMAADGAGALYVLGTSNSPSIAGEQGAGSTDLMLAKVERAKGDLDWVRLLGGTAGEGAIDLSVDPEGAAYVTGRSSSKSIADQHVAHKSGVFAARYDSGGSRDWIGFPDPALVVDQLARATAIGAYAGGAYVAGISAGEGPRSGPGRVVQFDDAGENHYWHDTEGIITDVAPLTEAGLGVAGYKNRNWPDDHPSAGGVDVFFSVLDATTGQGEWWARFGGTGDDRAVAVAALAGGGFAVLGTTDSPEVRGQKNRGGKSVLLAIYASTAQ